jgi:hypothetical protein
MSADVAVAGYVSPILSVPLESLVLSSCLSTPPLIFILLEMLLRSQASEAQTKLQVLHMMSCLTAQSTANDLRLCYSAGTTLPFLGAVITSSKAIRSRGFSLRTTAMAAGHVGKMIGHLLSLVSSVIDRYWLWLEEKEQDVPLSLRKWREQMRNINEQDLPSFEEQRWQQQQQKEEEEEAQQQQWQQEDHEGKEQQQQLKDDMEKKHRLLEGLIWALMHCLYSYLDYLLDATLLLGHLSTCYQTATDRTQPLEKREEGWRRLQGMISSAAGFKVGVQAISQSQGKASGGTSSEGDGGKLSPTGGGAEEASGVAETPAAPMGGTSVGVREAAASVQLTRSVCGTSETSERAGAAAVEAEEKAAAAAAGASGSPPPPAAAAEGGCTSGDPGQSTAAQWWPEGLKVQHQHAMAVLPAFELIWRSRHQAAAVDDALESDCGEGELLSSCMGLLYEHLPVIGLAQGQWRLFCAAVQSIVEKLPAELMTALNCKLFCWGNQTGYTAVSYLTRKHTVLPSEDWFPVSGAWFLEKLGAGITAAGAAASVSTTGGASHGEGEGREMLASTDGDSAAKRSEEGSGNSRDTDELYAGDEERTVAEGYKVFRDRLLALLVLLPVPFCCNNPDCRNLSGLSELELVMGSRRGGVLSDAVGSAANGVSAGSVAPTGPPDRSEALGDAANGCPDGSVAPTDRSDAAACEDRDVLVSSAAAAAGVCSGCGLACYCSSTCQGLVREWHRGMCRYKGSTAAAHRR